MYDVLYLDHDGTLRVVAASLERHSAITVARAEANARRIGRMFLAGSEPPPGRAVLIVDSTGAATVAAAA